MRSPDGGWIVYGSTSGNLRRVSPQGGAPVTIAPSAYASINNALLFTPNGQWVLFSKPGTAGDALYAVSINGGTVHLVNGQFDSFRVVSDSSIYLLERPATGPYKLVRAHLPSSFNPNVSTSVIASGVSSYYLDWDNPSSVAYDSPPDNQGRRTLYLRRGSSTTTLATRAVSGGLTKTPSFAYFDQVSMLPDAGFDKGTLKVTQLSPTATPLTVGPASPRYAPLAAAGDAAFLLSPDGLGLSWVPATSGASVPMTSNLSARGYSFVFPWGAVVVDRTGVTGSGPLMYARTGVTTGAVTVAPSVGQVKLGPTGVAAATPSAALLGLDLATGAVTTIASSGVSSFEVGPTLVGLLSSSGVLESAQLPTGAQRANLDSKVNNFGFVPGTDRLWWHRTSPTNSRAYELWVTGLAGGRHHLETTFDLYNPIFGPGAEYLVVPRSDLHCARLSDGASANVATSQLPSYIVWTAPNQFVYGNAGTLYGVTLR